MQTKNNNNCVFIVKRTEMGIWFSMFGCFYPKMAESGLCINVIFPLYSSLWVSFYSGITYLMQTVCSVQSCRHEEICVSADTTPAVNNILPPNGYYYRYVFSAYTAPRSTTSGQCLGTLTLSLLCSHRFCAAAAAAAPYTNAWLLNTYVGALIKTVNVRRSDGRELKETGRWKRTEPVEIKPNSNKNLIYDVFSRLCAGTAGFDCDAPISWTLYVLQVAW